MKITKKILTERIIEYLQRKISLAELVDWSENAMMRDDFDEKDFESINEIISSIGLADVKTFGLQWEDWEKYLNRLGYKVKVKAEAV